MAIIKNAKDIEDWREAGRIASEALQYGKKLIVPGARLVDVSDKIEQKILDLGGQMAFPAQISCDHIAAHYCAEPDDQIVFDKQVACLDVGVHVNGAIGDNALTVDLSGKNEKLVIASRKALDRAVSMVRPDATLGEIGNAIYTEITSMGFSPIVNLSGHGLDRFKIHTKPSVPNYNTGDRYRLSENEVIAIEPFATTGKGKIEETRSANIFSFEQKKPVRSPFARDILKSVETYNGLPFTTRWLTKKYPLFKVNNGIDELLRNNILHHYPPLVEVARGLVSQAEHTVIVTKDGCEILTK